MNTTPHSSSRRDLLKWSLAAGAAAGIGSAAQSESLPRVPTGGTLRDRFWIWTHAEGAYKREYNLPHTSRMTPVEGAAYLGVPNLLFIRYQGLPAMPFDQYAIAFRSMKQVVWSLVGASGQSDDAERRHVLELAARFPNITGFIMDDFFKPDGTGSLSVDQLAALRKQLVIDGRKRDLHVVLYQHQLGLPVQSHLEHCDKITFWTWEAKDLANLERAMDRLDKLTPKLPKILGCYMYDFGPGKPMPVDLMQKQCNLGRQWLEQGRIEGMIFLASNVCDLELSAVEWTRQWIAEVGSQRI